MNVTLLRQARATKHGRKWIVPGFGNAVSYMRTSTWGVPALSWPAHDGQGETVRTVRLDWHRSIARAELRRLIQECRA